LKALARLGFAGFERWPWGKALKIKDNSAKQGTISRSGTAPMWEISAVVAHRIIPG
jgi:hypothetical protein